MGERHAVKPKPSLILAIIVTLYTCPQLKHWDAQACQRLADIFWLYYSANLVFLSGALLFAQHECEVQRFSLFVFIPLDYPHAFSPVPLFSVFQYCQVLVQPTKPCTIAQETVCSHLRPFSCSPKVGDEVHWTDACPLGRLSFLLVLSYRATSE